jgi:hypothetical protein
VVPVGLAGAAEAGLCWFVREAWPSPATGTAHTEGLLAAGQVLRISAETDALVLFGDGMESDRIRLTGGQAVTLGLAADRLALVTAG